MKAISLAVLALLATSRHVAAVAPLDTVIFGDGASESVHAFSNTLTQVITGGLGQPARQFLPQTPEDVYGGDLYVTMAVDPLRRNYFTARFWGGDDTNLAIGRIYLYVPTEDADYQVGYRHEGDYLAPLTVTSYHPPLPGRFFYSTTLLPLWMTKGQTSLTVRLLSAGQLYGLGSGGPTNGNYQFTMKMPSRGLYRAYTHTEPFLEPAGEAQGTAPALSTRPTPVELATLSSTGKYTTGWNNTILNKLNTAVTNLTCGEVELLARSYSVTNLSNAHQSTAVVAKVVAACDAYAAAYYANTNAVTFGGNEAWGGRFGGLGRAIALLLPVIGTNVDTVADYGAGGLKARRTAWGDMLAASRDYGRTTRRTITNQELIADKNIYLANAGLLALGDARAFTAGAAERYLREGIGLEPWRGADLPAGGSAYLYGTNYFQVTPAGITKEWGYVGSYGEMMYFAADFYRMTSNTLFRDQAVKMSRARANFRRPAIDVVVSGITTSYYRSMERIGLLAWRAVRETDGDFANDLSYSDPAGWALGIRTAAVTLDTNLVGYAKQFLAENQYFNTLTSDNRIYSQVGDGNDALEVFADYAAIKAAPDSGVRLPQADGQPDFAWVDLDTGVVSLKRGTERLWLSTFWQCKYGTAINGLGRFHHSTTNFDRYGVLEEVPLAESDGALWVRPNWVDGASGTAYAPPDAPVQAYANEILPMPAVDASVRSQSPYRGLADFWTCRYGAYLIAINRSAAKTYPLKTPAGFTSATNLLDGALVTAPASLAPRSALVLLLGDTSDSCAVPTAPLALTGTASNTPGVSLRWTDASGAAGYVLKRATAPGGPYTTVAAGLTTNLYTDLAVSRGTSYYYAVSATNACGESYPSIEFQISAGLPAPWSSTDVGWVGVTGSTVHAGGLFKVRGSGGDIGGVSDRFHYAWAPMTNDGVFIARLKSLQRDGNTDKVGVMMRESATPGAKAAAAILDYGENKPRLAYRGSTGGSMSWLSLSENIRTPAWLRLSRAGSTFTASVSPDGVAWTDVGSASVTMSNVIQAGLAVCTRDNNALDVGAFDGVITPAWVQIPVAPSGVTGTPGNTQAQLDWSPAPGATGYIVKRSAASGGPYTVVASNLAAVTFTDSGLLNNVPYYYVVASLNTAGASTNSAEAMVTPEPQVPAAPDGVDATPGFQQVRVGWNTSVGATNYIVYGALLSGGPYTDLAHVTGTSYTQTGLVNGTTYYYIVMAQNSEGSSPLSAEVSAAPQDFPFPPLIVTASAGSSSVNLNWSPVWNALGYNVKRATLLTGPYATIAGNLTGTSFLDENLTAGVTYYYVVSTIGAGGEGANSTAAGATPGNTILPAPWAHQDVGAVGAAGSASYASSTFTLQAQGADMWGTSDQVHVVYQPLEGNGEIRARVVTLSTNSNRGAKSGVTIRESLYTGSKQASVFMTPGSGALFQCRSATDGSSTQVGSSSGRVVPYWVRLVRNGSTFTGYRSSNGSRWNSLGSTTIAMSNRVLIGLVLASRNASVMCTSTISSVTLSLSLPPAPADVVAVAGDARVDLAWSEVSGATNYVVKRAAAGAGTFSVIAEVAETAYTDLAVTNGSTYRYVVTAGGAGGQSADSEEVAATPMGVPAAAAEFWWDADGAGGAMGGAGAWSLEGSLWRSPDAVSPLVPWENLGPENRAVFSGNGGLVVNTAGVVNVNALSFQAQGYTVSGGLLNLTGSQTSRLTLVNAASVTIASPLAGSLPLVIDAATGTVTFAATNIHIGGIIVDAGTLSLSTGGKTGTILGALTVSSGATVRTTVTDALGYGAGSSVTGVLLRGGVFNNAASGNQGFLTTFRFAGGALTSSGGGAFNFSAGYGIESLTSAVMSTVSGNVSVRSGSGITIATESGSVPGGVDLQISGAVSYGSGGSGPLTKTGPGTLQLSGGNTFTSLVLNGGAVGISASNHAGRGAITYNGGALRVTNNLAMANDSSLTTSGGVLVVDQASALTNSGAFRGITGGSLAKAGPGLLALEGAVDNTNLVLNVLEGTVVLGKASSANVHAAFRVTNVAAGATVRLAGTGGDQVGDAFQGLNGTLDLNGRDETLLNLQGTNFNAAVINSSTACVLTLTHTANTTYSGSILETAGSMAVVKIGAAQIQLNGTNTWSGGTIISGGTLRVNAPVGTRGIGSGPLTLSGGTFFIPSQVVQSVFTNPVVVDPVTGNVVRFERTSEFAGTVSGAGTVTVYGANFNSPMTFSGVLTNLQGGLVLQCANSSVNTYLLTNTNAPGLPGARVRMQTTTNGLVVLQWGGPGSRTIPLGDLSTEGDSGLGRVWVRNGTTASTATFEVGALGLDSTFTGGLVANGTAAAALTKVGGGVWTLAGTNTYTGPTIVSNGTLAIATGGSLVSTTITIMAGAVFAPQAGFTNTGRQLRIAIAGAASHGRVQAGGAVQLGGLLAVETNGFAPAPGNAFTVLTASAVSGTFAATNLPAGYHWSVTYAPAAVVLSVTGVVSGYDLYAQQIVNGLAAEGDDADGDGYANLLEYVSGGNPTQQDALARMEIGYTDSVARIRFLRDTNSTDATLLLESVRSLVPGDAWSNIATCVSGVWVTGSVTETNVNPKNVSVEDAAGEEGVRVHRLRVTRP